MIIIKDSLKHFIQAFDNNVLFSEKVGVTRQNLYNILDGKCVTANTIAKVLLFTGWKFEDAFEIQVKERRKAQAGR